MPWQPLRPTEQENPMAHLGAAVASAGQIAAGAVNAYGEQKRASDSVNQTYARISSGVTDPKALADMGWDQQTGQQLAEVLRPTEDELANPELYNKRAGNIAANIAIYKAMGNGAPINSSEFDIEPGQFLSVVSAKSDKQITNRLLAPAASTLNSSTPLPMDGAGVPSEMGVGASPSQVVGPGAASPSLSGAQMLEMGTGAVAEMERDAIGQRQAARQSEGDGQSRPWFTPNESAAPLPPGTPPSLAQGTSLNASEPLPPEIQKEVDLLPSEAAKRELMSAYNRLRIDENQTKFYEAKANAMKTAKDEIDKKMEAEQAEKAFHVSLAQSANQSDLYVNAPGGKGRATPKQIVSGEYEIGGQVPKQESVSRNYSITDGGGGSKSASNVAKLQDTHNDLIKLLSDRENNMPIAQKNQLISESANRLSQAYRKEGFSSPPVDNNSQTKANIQGAAEWLEKNKGDKKAKNSGQYDAIYKRMINDILSLGVMQ